MSRLDDFVADIASSGLVPSGDVRRALSGLAREPDADAPARLARALIQQGKLTPYQARKLLAGATRGFFLGGYRILKSLGEGGMGKVFLAAREGDDKTWVAIKVLPPRKALEERHALLRFRREMDLSRRVTHPNLARTLDVGEADGVYFMVLEYVPGESLYQAVKDEGGGPLRVTDACRFFLKVVDGLEAAHDAGLIHRDIKPSNIMITPDGDAKVLDLGLARALGEVGAEDDKPLTRPNVVVGTLDYASPEQLLNASTADRRSDLYSLGCTLYFTLAGRAPFEGGDLVYKIFKQRMEDPEPLERVARGVPAAFAAVVRKLMAKGPDDRYQSCAELRPDLARWLDPEKVRAILGAEADSARAFRPPVPEIDDDDLRILSDIGATSSGVSLRDLGDAEPAAAPFVRSTPPPVAAVVVPPGRKWHRVADPGSEDDEDDDVPAPAPDDSRWLIQVIAVAVVLLLLAVLAITLFA
jgi:serine/threonine protein kinase